jgi:hypothetical protein
MTDKQAYEILLKYSDEKSLIMQKEMVRQIGVNETAKMIQKAYGKKLPADFKKWMKQGLKYLSNEMSKPNN